MYANDSKRPVSGSDIETESPISNTLLKFLKSSQECLSILFSKLGNRCNAWDSPLKVDTQGHEPEVLIGLGENLSKIDVVITELMFYDFYERNLSFSDIEKHLYQQVFIYLILVIFPKIL